MRSPLPRVSRRGKVTIAVVGGLLCPADLCRPARRPVDRLAVVRRGRLHERVRRPAPYQDLAVPALRVGVRPRSSAATSTWPSGCGRCCGPTRPSSTRWSGTGCCSRRGIGLWIIAAGGRDRAVRRPLRAGRTGSSGCCSATAADFGVTGPAVRRRRRLLRLRLPVLALPARRRLHRDRAGHPRRAGRALPVRRGAAAGRRRPDEHRGAGPPDRAGRVLRAAQGGRVLPRPAGAAARATTPAPTCGAPATPTSTRCCRPRRS